MLLIPLLAAVVKEQFRESRKHLEINHLYDARNGPSQQRIGTALWAVSRAIKCKPGAKRAIGRRTLTYSKRRISTGSNFAAARAGTRVARSEIPIATTEIHTPSTALG